MRRQSLFISIMLIDSFQFTHAQDIFVQHGFDKKPLTLSEGKYKEFFNNDQVVQIGTGLLNTKTNKVVAFVEEDTVKTSYLAEFSSRWLSVDPLAAKYSQFSPYVYCLNNPVKFIDPDGKEIRLSFQSDNARDAYINTVNKSFGGFYTASFTTISDGKGYNNQIKITPTSMNGQMTASQKAFYSEYNSVVKSDYIIRQDIVLNDPKTAVGSWVTSKVDMADVAAFDKAGPGAATSAGALIHETSEQLEKAKLLLSSNEIGTTTTDAARNKTYVDYDSSHKTATNSENNVNGNTRVEDGSGTDSFMEKDGTKTAQTVKPNSTGDVTVTKTKIP